MNYPSLCLNQDLIDKVFLETKQGIPRPPVLNKDSWSKRYYHKKKESRSQSGEVEECDQCDYKTTKFMAMYGHKREKHIGVKKKCTECDYSHVYPTKVRGHYNRVHMGLKSGIKVEKVAKCRKKVCENFGKPSCSDIRTHMLFFCNLCPLSFKRSDNLLFHNQNIHEGLIFSCKHCSSFSTARKYTLKLHILAKHTEKGSKPRPKGSHQLKKNGIL